MTCFRTRKFTIRSYNTGSLRSVIFAKTVTLAELTFLTVCILFCDTGSSIVSGVGGLFTVTGDGTGTLTIFNNAASFA